MSNTSLYHYTKYEVALDNILVSMKLKASPFSSTNDPLEYKQRNMCIGFDRVEAPSLPPEQVNRCWKDFIGRQTKALCFTTNDRSESSDHDAFTFGFAKPRMWAQYAENGHGLCFEFNLEKFLGDIAATTELRCVSIDAVDTITDMFLLLLIHGYVEYGLESVLQLVLPNYTLANDKIENIFTRFVLNNARNLLFTKASDWSAENEYRIVIISPSLGPEFISVKQALVAAFIGSEVSPDVDKSIFDRLKDKKCALYRMDWSTGIPKKHSRDQLHFLHKQVLQRVNRKYQEHSTTDRDTFVQEKFGLAKSRLYLRCVYDTPSNDTYDELPKLKRWLQELDSDDA